MDRRSWPWKKKLSEKAAAEKTVAASGSAVDPSVSAASQGGECKQYGYKKLDYVTISAESYTHLTGLVDQVKLYEEQVKTLEDEVKELNEKLSTTQSEITMKENLVKQHTKVAEEAVSGWEKAEAEASTLKHNLESVTLLKLTAEDRASHLDGGLKECMQQIRNLKEEHDQKLHEIVHSKTKQWEKIKHELEERIADLDQELLRSAAENDALSRSLQEHSNMLIKTSEQKSRAEAEIELLKSNIESCEKKIDSLKYELHIVTKELDIRNEEKNTSVRSAEVANKQHLEGVKKIAKLEAECQRLRSLVRKKLPGPAALARMKLEVENLGRDCGATPYRRSPGKPSSPYLSPLPEFSMDTLQNYHKENELLRERLWAMEEETKMLKEVLAICNSELQTSRSICAKTVSKHQSLLPLLQSNSDQKAPKSNVQILTENSSSQNASNPRSMTSISEYGNDDEVSCSGSWSRASIYELSHFKKEKEIESPNNVENVNHLKLMDDFLEMEKLAKLSNDSNGAIPTLDISNSTRLEIGNHNTSVEVMTGWDFLSEGHRESDLAQNKVSTELQGGLNPQPDVDLLPFVKLQSRIAMVFQSKGTNMDEVLENIRRVLQDMEDGLQQQSVSCVVEAAQSSDDSRACLEHAEVDGGKEICLSEDCKPNTGIVDTVDQELVTTVSQIHDFVLHLGKEAKAVQGTSHNGDELSQKLEQFSTAVNEVICNRISLADFVHGLSHVLAKASEPRFSVLDYKNSEVENSSSDCIDKVALPENKRVHDSLGGQRPDEHAHLSNFTSGPDISHEGSFVPTTESTQTSWKWPFEEFEKLKIEKDNMAMDLKRCTENLESTKSQLQEMEHVLAEVKSQLTTAQKLNSLAETQLKCMAESYKTLETRAEELQDEVNLLQVKTEGLDNELQEEKGRHQDALARCKDLQEQLQRIESCSTADNDAKINQERELAAAAEKLAECQENIFLLGKQLKALYPQTELMGSPASERSLKGQGPTEEEPTPSVMNLLDIDPAEMNIANSAKLKRVGVGFPMDLYNAPLNPSDCEPSTLLRSIISSQHPQQHSSRLASSSSSPGLTPEKHSRSFSRFFSSKGNNGH